MKAIRAIRALGPIDAQSVRRDSLLRWMVVIPLFVTALLRWGVPALAARVTAQFGFDLAPYYPLVMGLILLMTPILFGVVIGFLLLDQRDDHTLTALQVTPLTLNGYLLYRVAGPMLLSVLVTMVVFPLTGLVRLGTLPLLAAALSAAPLAPLYALFLASVAENKVQGFALQKAMGIVLLPPMAAYFIHAPWQPVLGLVPTYWPVRCFWALLAGEAGWWAYWLASVLIQALLLAMLVRRFNRVMSR